MILQNEEKVLTVVTHNGIFHADDVLGTVILRKKFGNIKIIRTYDKKIISDADIVFDIGGGKFDHHSELKEYRTNGVPYAASGLLWKEFGKEIILKEMPSLEPVSVNSIFNYIDKHLIQGIDAIDNGFYIGKTEVSITSISAIINSYNPVWDDFSEVDEKFMQAVDFTETFFNNFLEKRLATNRARQVVINSFENRINSKVLVLEQFCPWQVTLFEIDRNKEVQFVVFKDSISGYRVQGVPKELGKFEVIKKLPKSWAGKTDKEFILLTGVLDSSFCHPERFIAGALSLEGILELTKIAINS